LGGIGIRAFSGVGAAVGLGADPLGLSDGEPPADCDGEAVPDAVPDGVALGLAVSAADGVALPVVASADPASLIVTSVASGLDTETSASGSTPSLMTTIRSRASEPRS